MSAASEVIVNYTTEIDYFKSIGEIQEVLVKNGAERIMIEYENKCPVSLKFSLNMKGNVLNLDIPAKPKNVQRILQKAKQNRVKKGINDDFQQACRVAWRNIRSLIIAQMAMLETDQAEVPEMFMPYLLDDKGRRLYEVFCENGSLLLSEGVSTNA
ncbi:hypothetical protein LPY66_18290 [Dehalobacter sp. DCM]|uniref:hypothetical protein n=1 Tax=Dehalobacter sp. DCM TaxID=2907827 RepID=UPI0030814FF2|nr:hypothetical protein LPY66_18290 [Dehalobacter sp. DCM]